MIEFTGVEYKNLQSVGNHPIKVSLNRSSSTLIGGSNGSGKSTLLTAIAYCLFGKTLSGIKLQSAINSINKKNLLTKIWFKKNGEEFCVIRGEKPKKFEIYRNDELLDQYANARDQQKFLEVILGMDFKLFTQIMVLNKERYQPFMEMGAADRRKIIEDILDISIFSEMNEVTKQQIKELQRQEANLDKNAEVLRTKLSGQQTLINEIQNSIAEQSKDLQLEVNTIRKKIEDKEQEEKTIQDQMDEISTDGWNKVKKQMKEFESLARDFENKITQAKKNKKFFTNNDNCPTCEQPITSDLKDQKIKETDDEVNEVHTVIGEMMGELESLKKKDESFKEQDKLFGEKQFELNTVQFQISSLKSDLNSMLSKMSDTSSDEKLRDHINTYNQIESDLNALLEDYRAVIATREDHEMLRTLLKDDGIKATIIKEYNAIINKKINEYLVAMNFFINMTLDENFKEKFHAMNKESFTYDNLSTGQKARVNIAIWLALLEVASIKNSVVSNILFLDEILEPIDAQGIKDVTTLFKEKLYDKNIFVVTQRFVEFEDMFRSSIQFKLNHGFTEML